MQQNDINYKTATKYRNVAKELLESFIEDQKTIISEFSMDKEKDYAWLRKQVEKYAKRLEINVEEWLLKV